MKERRDEWWDQALRQAAARFDYPATPDVEKAVRSRLSRPAPAAAPLRGLAWTVLLVAVVAGALLLAPQVRAEVTALLRAGGITIFVGEPAADSAPDAVAPPVDEATATMAPDGSSEAAPLLAQASESSLPQARAAFAHPVALPAYPPDLGSPDAVFVDDERAPGVVLLVWMAPDEPQQPWLSLYLIEGQDFAFKRSPVVDTTNVNGGEAFWIEGPHHFAPGNGSTREWQVVTGNALIWWDDELTYRLEGASSMDEATRIAESLTVPGSRP